MRAVGGSVTLMRLDFYVFFFLVLVVFLSFGLRSKSRSRITLFLGPPIRSHNLLHTIPLLTIQKAPAKL